jgi:hypothetical protein
MRIMGGIIEVLQARIAEDEAAVRQAAARQLEISAYATHEHAPGAWPPSTVSTPTTRKAGQSMSDRAAMPDRRHVRANQDGRMPDRFRTGALGEQHVAGFGRIMAAIGLRTVGHQASGGPGARDVCMREGTSMDKEIRDPAEQDPDDSSSPANGNTVPKSNDGVWTTWTPDKSNFEPEEDTPAQAGESENAGDSDEQA